MILIDLHLLGLVPPCSATAAELAAVLACAEELEATTDPDVMATILTEWELALTWTSLSPDRVNEQWYYQALLVLCLRGLRGEMRPVWWT
jgi:hypothetical protein